MNASTQFLKSKPKEPRVYRKAGMCPMHKAVKLVKDDHECCGCCCGGECEPEYTCPKCEEVYSEKHAKWFQKWGHTCAVGADLQVSNKRLITMRGLHFQQFYHGGEAIKIGSWARLHPKTGMLLASRKKSNILVVS